MIVLKEYKMAESTLSNVKNSIANVCLNWLSNSKVEKEIKLNGVDMVKDMIKNDVNDIIGHGTSKVAGFKFIKALENAKGGYSLMNTLKSFMLAGDGMGLGESLDNVSKIVEFLKTQIYGNYNKIENPVVAKKNGDGTILITFKFPYKATKLDIIDIEKEIRDNSEMIGRYLEVADFDINSTITDENTVEVLITPSDL